MSASAMMENLESRQLMSAVAGLGVYHSAPATGSHGLKKSNIKSAANASVKKLAATTSTRPTTTSGLISGTVYLDVNQNGQFDPLIDLGNGGGTVYADLNNNGTLDKGEPNAIVSFTGAYSFVGLQKGTYTIREVAPIGFAEIVPSSLAYRISIGTGESVTNRDFFNIPAATVTGTVFSDINVDGAREDNEPGISGQVLFDDLNNDGIHQPGEPIATTDSRGGYTLTGLLPGKTNIRLIAQSNFRPVSPGNGVFTAELGAGVSRTVNFGEVRIF